MELGLRQPLRFERRWWWLLVLTPVVFALVAYGLRQTTSSGTTVYSASATILVSDSSSGGTPRYSPETYEALLQSMPKPVLEAVVDDLGLSYDADMLKTKVSGYLAPNTDLLVVTVDDADPRRAADIATAIAHRFVAFVGQQAADANRLAQESLARNVAALRQQIATVEQEIQTLTGGPDAETDSVAARLDSLRTTGNQLQQLLEESLEEQRLLEAASAAARSRVRVTEEASVEASVPLARPDRGGPFVALLGAFAGLLTAGGIIVLLAYLGNPMKAGANFVAITSGPLRTAVARFARLRVGPRQLFVIEHPRSDAAEAIRLLRTNVEFAVRDGELRSLAISSPGAGEGKSTITANLGVAMALAGFETVVIDANLRSPTQHRIFGVGNERGLTTLLGREDERWRAIAVDTKLERLALIPAGPQPLNPADLLSRERLRQLLIEIGETADIILVDTPSILEVSDPLVVAANVDGAILVCRSGRTRLDALRRATAALQQGAVRVVGVVLNQRADGQDEAERFSGTGKAVAVDGAS